jgi:hypothetical protein
MIERRTWMRWCFVAGIWGILQHVKVNKKVVYIFHGSALNIESFSLDQSCAATLE